MYSLVFLSIGILSIIGNDSRLGLVSLTSMLMISMYVGLGLYTTPGTAYLVGIMAFSLPFVACLHDYKPTRRDYVMLAGYAGLLSWEVLHMYGWMIDDRFPPDLDIVMSASFLSLVALSGVPSIGNIKLYR